jgi:uncharacterized damage-inducible protein DinB
LALASVAVSGAIVLASLRDAVAFLGREARRRRRLRVQRKLRERDESTDGRAQQSSLGLHLGSPGLIVIGRSRPRTPFAKRMPGRGAAPLLDIGGISPPSAAAATIFRGTAAKDCGEGRPPRVRARRFLWIRSRRRYASEHRSTDQERWGLLLFFDPRREEWIVMYQGNRWQLMADYNAWMNERLYAACGSLSDEERKRDRGAFFKSIHSTLNHILWADRVWMTRFTGKTYSPSVPLGTDVFADFGELSAARAALDAEIRKWASTLTKEKVHAPYIFVSQVLKVTRVQPTWAFAMHMFNHQTHHRGQLTTLLSQAGIDYGATDILLMPQLE